MADIQNATSNTTLWDELGNMVGVTLNSTTALYELNTTDPQALVELVEISGNTKDIHHYQEMGEAFYITYQVTLASKDTQYDVILITNPNASGKAAEIQNVDVSAVSVGGEFIKMRMYAEPTITTNGTTLNQYNARIGNASTSGINTFYLPTIAARGNLLSYQSSQLSAPFRVEHWLGTAIDPNYSMLFTLETTSNGSIVQITVKFASYTEA